MEKRYELYFKNRKCIIVDQWGNELLTTHVRDKLFPLNPNQTSMYAYSFVEDNSVIWYKRLGRFSYPNLSLLHQRNLLDGLTELKEKNELCEACLFGKQHKLPFYESNWRAVEKLQLIHSDVCGPMSTKTLNNSMYFLLFIDDYSRFCWVRFLKQKLEVFW